jgi:hypothetical protein
MHINSDPGPRRTKCGGVLLHVPGRGALLCFPETAPAFGWCAFQMFTCSTDVTGMQFVLRIVQSDGPDPFAQNFSERFEAGGFEWCGTTLGNRL